MLGNTGLLYFSEWCKIHRSIYYKVLLGNIGDVGCVDVDRRWRVRRWCCPAGSATRTSKLGGARLCSRVFCSY
jgi:hypothetical protein